MPDRPLRLRSLLFVPGDRPDMVAKVPRFSPDAVVVDLEDAVAPAVKVSARTKAVAAVDALASADHRPATILVRLNQVGSPWFAGDLAAVGGCSADGVVLPKLESTGDVAAVRGRLGPDPVVVGGLESARGVADARELLAGGVTAAYFGAEDYVADLGGRRTPDSLEVLYARSEVALAGRLAGVPVIDQIVAAVDDDERFRADARAGAALGYRGKLCIHPRQVALAHEVFTPTAEEVHHARRVIEAASAAGVTLVDGAMVDEVHLKLARSTLERAGDS